ncbi:MAG: dTMP kinase [Gammaproteobacteria bacterium]|nr:dTMP kinase [Gammaproteobacteria bacterium]
MPKNLGLFISLEGTEGAGKSTLAKFLQTYLHEKGVKVLMTREPGGTEIAEDIRHILLKQHQEALLPKTEALLMFASRVQHVEHTILPALHSGQWVISDRFSDASYAYQGAGRLLGFEKINELKQWSIGSIVPDVTFFLDVPLNIASQRLKNRPSLDRIESEKIDFFERVKSMYQHLTEKFPLRFYRIDASLPEGEVMSLARYKLDDLLRYREE